MPNKIREIEVGGKYKIFRDFENSTRGGIKFSIKENDQNGKEILNINETYNTGPIGKKEWSFDTDVNTIYINVELLYLGYVEPPPFSATLNNLNQHKTIEILSDKIQYAD